MTERPRLEIRRYVAGDALLVDLRPELAGELFAIQGLGHGVPAGKAWTLTRAGFVLGCGGFVPDGFGRATAWTLMSEPTPATRRAILWACKIGLAHWGGEFRRIEAHARADFPAAQRFLEHLGFDEEGVARAYGPDGADYVTYARVNR